MQTELFIGTFAIVEGYYLSKGFRRFGKMAGRDIYGLSEDAESLLKRCSSLFSKAVKSLSLLTLSAATYKLSSLAINQLPQLSLLYLEQFPLAHTALSIALLPVTSCPWIFTAAVGIGIIMGLKEGYYGGEVYHFQEEENPTRNSPPVTIEPAPKPVVKPEQKTKQKSKPIVKPEPAFEDPLAGSGTVPAHHTYAGFLNFQ